MQCSRYSDILLRNHPRIEELTNSETGILKSVVDYWAMMDPRNSIFDMASPDAIGSVYHPEKGGILTPPSSEILDGIAISVDPSEFDESETEYPVDPDIAIRFPVSTMSPMPSDDGGSPKWDWDSELNALNE